MPGVNTVKKTSASFSVWNKQKVSSMERKNILGAPTTLFNNLVSCIHGFKKIFNLVLYYYVYISNFKDFVHICKIVI